MNHASATPVGLYDPARDHSDCGVGFLTRLDGTPSHDVIRKGDEALRAIPHRGGTSAEGVGDGAGVSVDLSSWVAIRGAGPGRFREAVAALGPDAVFANEDEDRAFGGPLPATAWILKRGARGCSFAGEERPALPVERVVDATGAGDALAAGWIVGGPKLALEAAARCVARLGSMP